MRNDVNFEINFKFCKLILNSAVFCTWVIKCLFRAFSFYWSVSICKSASTVLQDEDNLTSRKSGNFYCLRIWLLYVDFAGFWWKILM